MGSRTDTNWSFVFSCGQKASQALHEVSRVSGSKCIASTHPTAAASLLCTRENGNLGQLTTLLPEVAYLQFNGDNRIRGLVAAWHRSRRKHLA